MEWDPHRADHRDKMGFPGLRFQIYLECSRNSSAGLGLAYDTNLSDLPFHPSSSPQPSPLQASSKIVEAPWEVPQQDPSNLPLSGSLDRSF